MKKIEKMTITVGKWSSINNYIDTMFGLKDYNIILVNKNLNLYSNCNKALICFIAVF